MIVRSVLYFPDMIMMVQKDVSKSRQTGEKTFAQDISAEVDFMPLSAQDSGNIDFVIPLDKIPDKLKSLAAALKI